jgi:cobalt ECF transporter T component CbiQ
MSESCPPRRRTFERIAHDLVGALVHGDEAEAVVSRRGLLQGLDPRAKLVACLSLILGVVLVHSLWALLGLLLLALGLAAVSGIGPGRLAKQVWIGVLLFTGVIALPSLFLVPGDPLWQVPGLHWQVTEQGARSAAFLVGRAEVCATLAALLVLSTPWMQVLKALRALGVPVVVVAILGMTHRYIFVLLQTALQMFDARRSRMVAPMSGAQRRQVVVGAAGVLLAKSFHLASEVHLAMVSRGYRGEVHLLTELRMRRRDRVVLLTALALPLVILWSRP